MLDKSLKTAIGFLRSAGWLAQSSLPYWREARDIEHEFTWVVVVQEDGPTQYKRTD